MAHDAAGVKSSAKFGKGSTDPRQDRSGRREEHRAQRRAALVRAAMAAIRKHGPDVAMEHIAAEAGISKPILYRYFQDKADLYMAVSEQATQVMRTALLSGLGAQAEPRALLGLVIDTYLTFIEEQPDLYRFVVRRSFPDRPVQRDPVTTNNELIAGTLTTIFSDRLRELQMDPGGAATWAHAGVGMVQAAGDWWLERRTLSREALRDYLLMMIWGALDGILRAGGSPTRMRQTDTVDQPPTEKPTRRLSEGPIST
ncbi:MAG: TetR family transcriptional regulator [Pseudonocardiaceae bacterium]